MLDSVSVAERIYNAFKNEPVNSGLWTYQHTPVPSMSIQSLSPFQHEETRSLKKCTSKDIYLCMLKNETENGFYEFSQPRKSQQSTFHHPFRFKCTMCSYVAAWNADLAKHILTHTGEKPHACAQCGKRFSRKENLKRHFIIVHNLNPSFPC
ncbi:hypothetical protein JTE90_008130 [Oedothorax gibbosus]|uniref:C2H2-type domain-containing protein n=1 Tax=Oedothorax gibbosus TaxID=931172 RepID=A0AAV6TWY7_9ARAC|nr:hypothetical protein JTE90_008130 [Oedothorax gibbosus]